MPNGVTAPSLNPRTAREEIDDADTQLRRERNRLTIDLIVVVREPSIRVEGVAVTGERADHHAS